MTDESITIGATFVNGFEILLIQDARLAMVTLLSAFVHCYSMLDGWHRKETLRQLTLQAKRMGEERFEDDQDFISFIVQQFEEEGE